jgi:hypothetical protein
MLDAREVVNGYYSGAGAVLLPTRSPKAIVGRAWRWPPNDTYHLNGFGKIEG